MLKTKQACEVLNVHPNTLRKWAENGTIDFIRAAGGYRLYDISSFLNKDSTPRARIIYARVSSKGQRDDLSSQIKYLRERYPDYELIEDIGGGLNFKRKGFKALLDRLLSNNVEEIVITHKDRLCRFGFELLEQLAGKFNTKLLVLGNTELSPQEELVQDIVSILHTFSCRIYGLRKYSSKIKEDKDLPKARKSK